MPNNAQMDVVPLPGGRNRYKLTFAQASIEWELPSDVPPMPVAINWGKLGEDCDLITMTEIVFKRGRFGIPVPKGYEFDGASIPRLIRWAPGYERVGRHLWAALLHDWILDDGKKPFHERQVDLPRVIADAIFITLLLDTGVSPHQSRWMHRAVRLYSAYAWWLAGSQSSTITETTKEAAKAPESKAVAVRDAAESAKEETSVPPCEENCIPEGGEDVSVNHD